MLMLLVLVFVSKQSLRIVLDVFCAESASFDELAGVMKTFTSCWIQTTFVYYIFVGQSLPRPSFHSASHIAPVTSLKKIVSINYLHCFRQWDSTIGPDRVCDKRCREEQGQGQDLLN